MSVMIGTDWYGTLGIARDADDDTVAAAVAKRSKQASALATTAPERSQQLREQVRAMKHDLLSGAEARAAYDAALAHTAADAAPAPAAPPVTTATPPDTTAAPPVTTAVPPPAPLPAGPPAPRRSRFREFMQSGWTCPHCGESAMPRDKYCTQCRAQLTSDGSYVPVSAPVTNAAACMYCGTVAASTHRFCRGCGATRH